LTLLHATYQYLILNLKFNSHHQQLVMPLDRNIIDLVTRLRQFWHQIARIFSPLPRVNTSAGMDASVEKIFHAADLSSV
jgi:hypothetical protein